MSGREKDWRKTIPNVIKEVLPKWKTISKEMIVFFTKEILLTSKGEQKKELLAFVNTGLFFPIYNGQKIPNFSVQP